MFASGKSYLWSNAGLLIYLVLPHPAAAVGGKSSGRAYVRAEQLLNEDARVESTDGVRFHDAAQRCSKENYAKGTWNLTSSAKKQYLCCSWDKNSDGKDGGHAGSRFCQDPTNLLTQRSFPQSLVWKFSVVEERTHQHSWPYFKFLPFREHTCQCSSTPSTPDQMLNLEKYEWKPSACALEPFDAATFCHRLKGRTLAVIGDSTGQQAGSALINMVIGGMPSDGIGCAPQITVVSSDTLMGGHHFPANRWPSGNASWAPIFRQADDLADSNGADTAETENARATKIIQLLVNVTAAVDHGFDVLVLGTGPHFRSTEIYQTMLTEVADAIKARRKKPNPPQFLWKTISGMGCGQINTVADLGHGMNPLETNVYRWGDFKEYDRMARQQMRGLTVPIVDMDMLYLRGDAHHLGGHSNAGGPGECLHFCSPGPLDVFAQVLSHMLS